PVVARGGGAVLPAVAARAAVRRVAPRPGIADRTARGGDHRIRCRDGAAARARFAYLGVLRHGYPRLRAHARRAARGREPLVAGAGARVAARGPARTRGRGAVALAGLLA